MTQRHPRDLAEAESATGRVHFGEDTDWYRVTVPDGQHSLALTVDGPLSVGAALTLQTLDGVVVPMTFGPGEDPGSVTYLASVEPSASYLVEVSQPQSSVVVSFDSSASVATQVSAIESGLRALAEGMSGDREALRIVPFDNQPLLPDWSSDRYEIADAVNRFRLDESSSAAESNLREAAVDLASREGGRAILLITDAASSSFDETAKLWAALSTSRPQVFTVAVGGEGEAPAIERHHLMADWAASAGGVSSQARGGERSCSPSTGWPPGCGDQLPIRSSTRPSRRSCRHLPRAASACWRRRAMGAALRSWAATRPSSWWSTPPAACASASATRPASRSPSRCSRSSSATTSPRVPRSPCACSRRPRFSAPAPC